MARFLWAVIFLLIIAGAGHTQAPAPAASPQPGSTGRPDAAHPEAAQKSKSTTALHPENVHHSPEPQAADQQQKFMENLHRWQALSPEEREVLRQRQRLNEKSAKNQLRRLTKNPAYI